MSNERNMLKINEIEVIIVEKMIQFSSVGTIDEQISLNTFFNNSKDFLLKIVYKKP